MKFLVDAQLPKGITWILNNRGHDAIHTDDLPNKEQTTDSEIREISTRENRIVISKDSDFIDSYHIKGVPSKILIITTGNIKNKELYDLFSKNLDQIIMLFKDNNLVEMDNFDIISHE